MQVNHSQKISDKPLTSWVIAEEGGKITAHCDCIAGLGESCTHVTSLLFAIESGVCIRDSMTVTQKKAHWVMPTGVKEVPYTPVKDITFVERNEVLQCWNHCSTAHVSPAQCLPFQDPPPYLECLHQQLPTHQCVAV